MKNTKKNQQEYHNAWSNTTTIQRNAYLGIMYKNNSELTWILSFFDNKLTTGADIWLSDIKKYILCNYITVKDNI